MMRRIALSSAALVAGIAMSANAQDTRTVVEPHVPSACVSISAELVPVADTTLADSDESKLDTKRIQSAIDHCTSGRAVVLKTAGTKRAFVTGPLILKAGVTLVVDTNAILFASRNPREYDLEAGRCGTVDERGHACKALITAERATSAGVMGPGTIDGRGWAKLLGQKVSWWDLAQDAKVKNQFQSCPRLMQLNRSDDFTLYRITLKNSPNFHVVYDRGNGFTAWGVVINTQDKRARNTDGIDPASAKNVTITHSYINTGDDDVAIKAGNTGPSSNITISHNHFYRGHGVSIGSETDGGAHAIRVFDLSIDGADNGLRIKSNASRGGLVQDVEYRDVCIRNTKNVIEMDTHYTASAQTTGALIPEFRDIRLKGVRVVDGGSVILDGYDAARPLRMSWDDVVFDKPSDIKIKASFATIAKGPGPSNLVISGEGVSVTGATSDAPRLDCERKFVPFPRNAASIPQGGGDYAAVVDARFTGTEGTLVDGTPTFRSIGSALTSLPANGSSRAIVFIRNGLYREKLTVDRPRVTLLGESRDGAALTYDAASDTPTPTGGSYGTRGSFTLRVVAPDFHAERMTIENAFDYPANAAKPDSDKTKFKNPQGVALMTDLGSDRAVFENVKITGYQDTLFPNSGRSYFHACEVWGHVDFIFGAGQAVFDECTIVSRDRGSQTNNGYVTAPSTKGDQPFGFLFVHSRLTKESPAMAANSVTLGRPWHPFADATVNSSAAFVDCWMDDHIGERGWDRMSSVDSTGTRVWYEPSSARFFELN
ncbi:MAG TPA: pectinesterase family protein, partial [Gemmatimonadaceae bacterium]|nr:pectinesterase family protein [Gemmatimonadaceae bacterium]